MALRLVSVLGVLFAFIGSIPATASGPRIVVQTLSTKVYPVDVPNAFVAAGSHVYFDGEDAAHGVELWTTDGTAKGTHLLNDLNPGTASSDPTDLSTIGTHLYFLATSAKAGEQVWETTNGKTVGQISHFGALGCCSGLVGAGSHFFVNAPHMWIGSDAGHSLVSTNYTFPANEMSYGGSLYFTGVDASSQGAANATDGQLLFVNGRTTARAILTSFNRRKSSVQDVVATNAGVYALVGPTFGGPYLSLWETHGSIARLVSNSGPNYAPRTCVAGKELFYTRTVAGSVQIWRSNGTSSGTVLTARMSPGIMIGQGNNLIFQAPDGAGTDIDIAQAGKNGSYTVTRLIKHTDAIPVAASANSVLLENPIPQKPGQSGLKVLLPATKQVVALNSLTVQTYTAARGVWPLAKDAYVAGVNSGTGARLVKITVSVT